jgi:type II secretory pathway predicted ATPase ExeA
MYKQFYGLKDNPFSKGNPLGFFEYTAFREAQARINTAIAQNEISLITGDTGAGKTTLLRSILAKMDVSSTKCAYVADPSQKPRAILREISLQLGTQPPYLLPDVLANIRNHIQNLANQKITPIILFDDIQLAEFKTIEFVRMLSNFDMDAKNRVAIILSGHHDFRAKLKLSAYQSLNQRIFVRFKMPNLSMEETLAYIQFQTKQAGAKRDIFADEALQLIYNITKGLPRKINLICSTALMVGAAENITIIGPTVIKRIIDDNDLDGAV